MNNLSARKTLFGKTRIDLMLLTAHDMTQRELSLLGSIFDTLIVANQDFSSNEKSQAAFQQLRFAVPTVVSGTPLETGCGGVGQATWNFTPGSESFSIIRVANNSTIVDEFRIQRLEEAPSRSSIEELTYSKTLIRKGLFFSGSINHTVSPFTDVSFVIVYDSISIRSQIAVSARDGFRSKLFESFSGIEL